MPRWAKLFAIVLGLIVAIGMTAYYVSASRKSAAADEWPVAEGQVVATRMDRRESRDSDGELEIWYKAVVTYTYSVGGRSYRSERLHLNETPAYYEPSDAEAFLREYRVGTPVDVLYNPDNPADAAVITDGPSWIIFILIGMGVVFAAFGWFVPAERKRGSVLSEFKARQEARRRGTPPE